MEFKLGVDICFGKKRWPEPTDWTPIIKNTLGLDIIEFDSDYLDPFFSEENDQLKIAQEVKKAAKDNGIFIHNYFTGNMTHDVNMISHTDERFAKVGIKWYEKALRIATQLGAKGLGSHFNCIPSKIIASNKYDMYLENKIDILIHLSEIAYNEGHTLFMLEPMYTPAEAPYTIKQTHEMIERINKKAKMFVSPVIDLGHSCCQNFPHSKEDRNPYKWLEEFGSMAELIHVQQTTADASNHWPFTKEYNEIGIIKPELVVQALEKSGSKLNYLMLEIFLPLYFNDEQIIDAMIETVNYWKAFV